MIHEPIEGVCSRRRLQVKELPAARMPAKKKSWYWNSSVNPTFVERSIFSSSALPPLSIPKSRGALLRHGPRACARHSGPCGCPSLPQRQMFSRFAVGVSRSGTLAATRIFFARISCALSRSIGVEYFGASADADIAC